MRPLHCVSLLVLASSGCDSPGSGGAGVRSRAPGGGTADTTVPTGVEPTACLVDVPCEYDGDCAGGQRCNTALDSPECQWLHCGGVRTVCSAGPLCEPDLVCSQALGVCSAGGAGEVCAIGSDCRDGLACPVREHWTSGYFTISGAPMAWQTTGRVCIAVTYTPELAPYHDLVVAAMAEWIAPGCTDLCFEGPTESAEEAGPDTRRLHIAAAEATWTNHLVRERTGEILGATVHVVAWLDGGPGRTDFMGAIASGLGLQYDPDWSRESLEGAVCAWYPIMRCQ